MSQVCSRCKKKSLYEQFKRKEERDRQLAEANKQKANQKSDSTEAMDSVDTVPQKKTRKKSTPKTEEAVEV